MLHFAPRMFPSLTGCLETIYKNNLNPDIGDENKIGARFHPGQKLPYANSVNYNSQAFKLSKNVRGQSFNNKRRWGWGAYNNRQQWQ